MGWGIEVVEQIKPYDLILVDSNLFTLFGEPGLPWKLYDIDFISKLESVEEETFEFNEDLHWKLEYVVNDDRVFTIP